MSLEDVQAVIDSAKARGFDHLQGYIRQRAPDMSEPKIQETADLRRQIRDRLVERIAEMEKKVSE